MRARRIPPTFNNSLMGSTSTRMCKACKEASKSVVFSRPLDFMRAKSTGRKAAPGMVACPRCGTLWETARAPGTAAAPLSPGGVKKP